MILAKQFFVYLTVLNIYIYIDVSNYFLCFSPRFWFYIIGGNLEFSLPQFGHKCAIFWLTVRSEN